MYAEGHVFDNGSVYFVGGYAAEGPTMYGARYQCSCGKKVDCMYSVDPLEPDHEEHFLSETQFRVEHQGWRRVGGKWKCPKCTGLAWKVYIDVSIEMDKLFTEIHDMVNAIESLLNIKVGSSGCGAGRRDYQFYYRDRKRAAEDLVIINQMLSQSGFTSDVNMREFEPE